MGFLRRGGVLFVYGNANKVILLQKSGGKRGPPTADHVGVDDVFANEKAKTTWFFSAIANERIVLYVVKLLKKS
jgi:hypothetical protein